MRTKQFAALDPGSPLVEHVGIAAHVTHSGHPVCYVEGIDHFFIPCRRDEGAVHMHIPQTRNQVFSIGIDDVNVPAFGDKPNFPHSRYAVFGDDDRHAFFKSTIPCIHHVDIGENEHFRVSFRPPQR